MDHYERSSLNYFAANPMDRLVLKRRDDAWLAAQLRADTTRFVPLWRSKNLLSRDEPERAIFLTSEEVGDLAEKGESVLLGSLDGLTYFALEVAADVEPPKRFAPLGEFRGLHSSGRRLEAKEGAILAYAKGMLFWHQRHHFCGECGEPTESVEGGFVRQCINKHKHFPRTDPAIIVLIESGERCLLGRQPSWAAGRYSVIAGFVEPGESVEDAVLREAREEANIDLVDICYHSSQPWPFPSSLMLGYIAKAATTDIQLIDDELEDARWISREEMVAELKNETLFLPPDVSISRHLIETWFDAGACGKLRDVAAGRW